MGNAQNAEITFDTINQGNDFDLERLMVNFSALQPIQNVVTKKSFMSAFHAELQRREQVIFEIANKIQANKEKLKVVQALQKDQRKINFYNEQGINPDSLLAIQIKGTRNMECFGKKGSLSAISNQKQVFKVDSLNLSTINLKFQVPIQTGEEIVVVSVSSQKCQGSFQIRLESLLDQEVHKRWYDLVLVDNNSQKLTQELNEKNVQIEKCENAFKYGSIKLQVQ